MILMFHRIGHPDCQMQAGNNRSKYCVHLYHIVIVQCLSLSLSWYRPSNAIPAQWLSSIAEDPKSRSFSWAGQVSGRVVPLW